MNTEQLLLEQVSAINKKYDEIAEITGENYNVFRILQVESSEVRLHSAFIANLLDTKGTHGQKDAFLIAFIKVFDLQSFESENNIDSEVSVEFFIGNISTDYNCGGRIDILVKANNKTIVMENKIYAGDQEKQLIRYHNAFPNPNLLYLTLDGKKPDDSSIKDDNGVFLKEGVNYKCVSYKKHVKEWLILCKEKAVNQPILRETITQYINLINILTNQAMSEKQNSELINLIVKNRDYIKSAKNISDSWYQIKLEIMSKAENRIKQLSETEGLKVEFNNGNFGAKNSGCAFYKEKWKYWIYFEFEGDFAALNISIVKSNYFINASDRKFLYSDTKFKTEINSQLSTVKLGGNYNDGETWAWAQWFDKWGTIDWEDVIEKLPEEIINAVNLIVNITKDIDFSV